MMCDARSCATCKWAKVTCVQVPGRRMAPLLTAIGPAHCAQHSQDEKLLQAFGIDGAAAVEALDRAQQRIQEAEAEVDRLTKRCAQLERAKWVRPEVERPKSKPRQVERATPVVVAPLPVGPLVCASSSAAGREVVRLVARQVGLPIHEIVGQSRVARVLLARAALAFVLRERLFTFGEIGALLGGRDHSTIMSALRDSVQCRAREMYPQVYAAFEEEKSCKAR